MREFPKYVPLVRLDVCLTTLFQVILNSMHKFQPRVYLVKRREGDTGPVHDIEKEKYRTFVFPESQFTAVTAYQNQLVRPLERTIRKKRLFTQRSIPNSPLFTDHQTED